mmetsp:Transcript_55837/g.141396  ORF Transcript_55837/g.141396 Transcript_55837/m.141396 type:complete len:155 (+) Transcript_55837:1033-1497(+)
MFALALGDVIFKPTCVGAERLNWSKFKSTPCGATADLKGAAMDMALRGADNRGCAATLMALSGPAARVNWRVGPTARPAALVANNVDAGRPRAARPATTEVETRLGAKPRPTAPLVAMSVDAGLLSAARPATNEVATRLGAAKRKRSMPKSTPP